MNGGLRARARRCEEAQRCVTSRRGAAMRPFTKRRSDAPPGVQGEGGRVDGRSCAVADGSDAPAGTKRTPWARGCDAPRRSEGVGEETRGRWLEGAAVVQTSAA